MFGRLAPQTRERHTAAMHTPYQGTEYTFPVQTYGRTPPTAMPPADDVPEALELLRTLVRQGMGVSRRAAEPTAEQQQPPPPRYKQCWVCGGQARYGEEARRPGYVTSCYRCMECARRFGAETTALLPPPPAGRRKRPGLSGRITSALGTRPCPPSTSAAAVFMAQEPRRPGWLSRARNRMVLVAAR